MYYNKHYIRIREDGCIIDGFSDAFRKPTEEAICINEKGSYQFRLFTKGQENPSLVDWKNRIPLYKYEDGAVVKRTEDEIEAERETIPFIDPQPTETEQLRADVDYLAVMTGIEL